MFFVLQREIEWHVSPSFNIVSSHHSKPAAMIPAKEHHPILTDHNYASRQEPNESSELRKDTVPTTQPIIDIVDYAAEIEVETEREMHPKRKAKTAPKPRKTKVGECVDDR